MKNLSKGGIATIVVTVIMVGIVLALLVGTVVPMATEGRETAQVGVDRLSDLQGRMGG